MLFNWGKKKLKPEEVARMFVHATLDSIEDAWPEVLGLLRETPHLERAPEIEESEVGPFLLVVMAGNLDFIPHFYPRFRKCVTPWSSSTSLLRRL